MIQQESKAIHEGVLTDREMRILSFLTLGSITLMIIVSTIIFSHHASGGQFDLGLTNHEPIVLGELHPTILPTIAMHGGTLKDHGQKIANEKKVMPRGAVPPHPSTHSPAETRLERLRAEKLRRAEMRIRRQHEASAKRKGSGTLPPLPLPASSPPPGHPKPCFKDC